MDLGLKFKANMYNYACMFMGGFHDFRIGSLNQ